MSAIKEYADVHVDKMNLKEDINRDKVKEHLQLASRLDTAEHRMEDLEFSENDLLHFKGFIFLQRYGDKVTVAYCIVNVFMKPPTKWWVVLPKNTVTVSDLEPPRNTRNGLLTHQKK